MAQMPDFRLRFATEDDRETLSLILDYAKRYLLSAGGGEKDARAALSSLGFRHQERLCPGQRLCGYLNVDPSQFLAIV
jgi:hypothetical protein